MGESQCLLALKCVLIYHDLKLNIEEGSIPCQLGRGGGWGGRCHCL